MGGSRASVLQMVRNKNNLAELLLQREVDEYRREFQSKMYQIEIERGDWRHFLREIRVCDSDDMSEFAPLVLFFISQLLY